MTEHAWLDEGEVSPAWSPPAGDPARPSRVQRLLAYAGVPLAFALLIGLVYLAGGFGRRTDRLTPVAPGATITTGPFELSFTEATAQARVNSDKTPGWEVVVIGRARNTSDETTKPSTFGDDGLFVLYDPASTRTELPYSTEVGEPNDGPRKRSNLAPGLPATDYRVIFRLPGDYVPGATVELGVAELVFEAKYLTTDEKSWDNGPDGYRVDLPLRVLPPETP